MMMILIIHSFLPEHSFHIELIVLLPIDSTAEDTKTRRFWTSNGRNSNHTQYNKSKETMSHLPWLLVTASVVLVLLAAKLAHCVTHFGASLDISTQPPYTQT